MTKLKVRIASKDWAKDEFAKIQDFYEKNRDRGNSIRDPEKLMSAIKDNKAYIIEDTVRNEIVGVSFCFVLNNGDYTEAGGTRITLGGYRLQRVINYVKAMHEFLLDPPSFEYYSIVANWNATSSNNLLYVGFEEWTPEQSLIDLIGSPLPEGKTFYRLPRSKLCSIRDAFLDIVEARVLSGRDPLVAVPIDFDIKIIREKMLTRDTEFPE